MRSRAWYGLCLVPAIAGVLVGLRLLGALDEQIAAMQRMIIPGSHTFALEAGAHVIYGESKGVVRGVSYENDAFTFETACTLVDAANRPIALDPISISNAARYRRNGYRGYAMFDMTVATAGSYTLGCEGDGTGDAIVAVGQGIRVRALVALLLIVAGVGAGVVGAVYLYFRRRKAVQRARG